MKKKTKILVTGAAGFIGCNLVDALLKRRYKVTAVDNLSMGKMDNIKHNLSNPSFSFKKIDVRDLKKLKEAARGSKIIVHLAAYKIPLEENMMNTLLVNGQGSINVFKVANDLGCKVVFASTSDVYGKSRDLPFREDGNLVLGSSYVQRWAYAASKIFDEHLAIAYRDEYKLPIVGLRYFGCYGPRYDLSKWGGPQPVFISAILGDKEIDIHGTGLQTRCFIYIDDLIRGTIAAIESKKADGKIFNIGTDEEISILDLAKLIRKILGVPWKLKIKFIPLKTFYGGKYEEIERRVPDTSQAEKILGFRPKFSLEEGLKKTIEWQKKEMEK